MVLTTTSDLHGHLPEHVPETDLLIIAGDLCPIEDHSLEYQRGWLDTVFRDWLENLPVRDIVGIAGNHDFIAERDPDFMRTLPWHYLQDEHTSYPGGLVIHGTPWTPEFHKWAFMADDSALVEKWDLIPEDVGILVVHGPPKGILDNSTYYAKDKPLSVGSGSLRTRLEYGSFPNLKLVVFGHVHEAYGTEKHNGVIYANAAYCGLPTEDRQDYTVRGQLVEFLTLFNGTIIRRVNVGS